MLFRAGVPRHAIIKKFAGEEILQLEQLISVLSKLSRGARVPLEYVSYTDRHRRKVYYDSYKVSSYFQFHLIMIITREYMSLFGLSDVV